jgi:predicted ArsR family transcriptional regulator
MPKPTRRKIVDFLAKHSSSSAEDISNALSMTKENIQYHLKRLNSDGLTILDKSVKKEEIIRGRPTLYYRLADPVYPSNINHLAGCLLRLVLKNKSAYDSQQTMKELAQALIKPAETRNLSHALQLAVKQLNEHHYHASWEARLKSPRIIFRNCPYAALLKDHPELCSMDRLILETLTHSSVIQITKTQFGRSDNSFCVFELKSE